MLSKRRQKIGDVRPKKPVLAKNYSLLLKLLYTIIPNEKV